MNKVLFLTYCLISTYNLNGQIAKCNLNVYKTLDSTNFVKLKLSDIDMGSKDYSTIEICPDIIYCSNNSQTRVILRASEANGLSSACYSYVHLMQKNVPFPPTCKDTVTISLIPGQQFDLIPELCLSSYYPICQDNPTVTLRLWSTTGTGGDSDEDKLKRGYQLNYSKKYFGPNYRVKIKDPYTGYECSSMIEISEGDTTRFNRQVCCYDVIKRPFKKINIANVQNPQTNECLQFKFDYNSIYFMDNKVFEDYNLDIQDVIRAITMKTNNINAGSVNDFLANVNKDLTIDYQDSKWIRDHINYNHSLSLKEDLICFSKKNISYAQDSFFAVSNQLNFLKKDTAYLYFMGKKGDLNFSFNDELNPDSCYQLNLITNDIRIIADQEYDIPLLLDRDINIDGIQLSFLENSSIHSGSLITSNTLNNFTEQSQMHNANGKVCVTWIQSDSLPLNNPFVGKQENELFTLHFKSKINGYLHEILNLSGIKDNMIVENHGPKYTISLFYRNFILDSKNLLKNNGYTVTPNPALDHIRIINLGGNTITQNQFEYSVYSMTGKLIEKAYNTGNEIKISDLAPGVYGLKLLFNKSETQVFMKFLKI